MKIKNFSKEMPVKVNDEIVESRKELKSGDIISILGSSMRWESKAEARRKFLTFRMIIVFLIIDHS